MKKRALAIGLAAFATGVSALAAAAVALGQRRASGGEGERRPSGGESERRAAGAEDAHHADGGEGHAAPDLAPDAEPAGRAPVAFRPDMDAPMTAAEREALRPPSGPSPTLVDTATSLPSGA